MQWQISGGIVTHKRLNASKSFGDRRIIDLYFKPDTRRKYLLFIWKQHWWTNQCRCNRCCQDIGRQDLQKEINKVISCKNCYLLSALGTAGATSGTSYHGESAILDQEEPLLRLLLSSPYQTCWETVVAHLRSWSPLQERGIQFTDLVLWSWENTQVGYL